MICLTIVSVDSRLIRKLHVNLLGLTQVALVMLGTATGVGADEVT